ncbi:MAG: hypothetical protein QOJ66_3282, partial [Ilumatobacteraceae bacterium]
TIEATDTARRAEEVADRKAVAEGTKVADVLWTASGRISAPPNDNGFTETVTLTITNHGPHSARDVAFEVPTPGLSYDMSHVSFGVLHMGEKGTATMRMRLASIGGMNPTIQVHWNDGRDGRQTFERDLTPEKGTNPIGR